MSPPLLTRSVCSGSHKLGAYFCLCFFCLWKLELRNATDASHMVAISEIMGWGLNSKNKFKKKGRVGTLRVFRDVKACRKLQLSPRAVSMEAASSFCAVASVLFFLFFLSPGGSLHSDLCDSCPPHARVIQEGLEYNLFTFLPLSHEIPPCHQRNSLCTFPVIFFFPLTCESWALSLPQFFQHSEFKERLALCNQLYLFLGWCVWLERWASCRGLSL